MSTGGLCNDCRTNLSRFEIRKRHLCTDCLQSYVGSKVSKQMVSYDFRNLAEEQNRRLLLPLSGGPCSLSLLYILNNQLKRQIAKRNRTAYDIVLVHVQVPDVTNSEQVGIWRDAIISNFPFQKFLPLFELHNVFDLDDRLETDLKELGLARMQDEANADLIVRLFSAGKTATARADLLDILLQRCLVAIARQEGCEGVVWGHSDSRLAAKTLADVAKGRGGAIPNAILDGPSPYGLEYKYPVRELFRSELELYLETTADSGHYLLPTNGDQGATVATRNTSIDDLLTGYISSQGEKYPGIMANVVRTASKLQLPSGVERRCPLCCMPISTTPDTMNLCYGCARMKKEFKT